METEITNAETSSEFSLSEPHFDDEATILSARPVVPLDGVPSYQSPYALRLTRRWILAAIVLGSLLLGVVGGAGYYSYLNRSPGQVLLDTDELAAGVEGISSEQARATYVATPDVGRRTPAQSDNAPAELSEKEISASLKQPADYPEHKRRPVARRVGVITFPTAHDEERIRKEREEQMHDERKAARKEEKRRQHELVEREKRRSRDELTRIREIFEGPQKP